MKHLTSYKIFEIEHPKFIEINLFKDKLKNYLNDVSNFPENDNFKDILQNLNDTCGNAILYNNQIYLINDVESSKYAPLNIFSHKDKIPNQIYKAYCANIYIPANNKINLSYLKRDKFFNHEMNLAIKRLKNYGFYVMDLFCGVRYDQKLFRIIAIDEGDPITIKEITK